MISYNERLKKAFRNKSSKNISKSGIQNSNFFWQRQMLMSNSGFTQVSLIVLFRYEKTFKSMMVSLN